MSSGRGSKPRMIAIVKVLVGDPTRASKSLARGLRACSTQEIVLEFDDEEIELVDLASDDEVRPLILLVSEDLKGVAEQLAYVVFVGWIQALHPDLEIVQEVIQHQVTLRRLLLPDVAVESLRIGIVGVHDPIRFYSKTSAMSVPAVPSSRSRR